MISFAAGRLAAVGFGFALCSLPAKSQNSTPSAAQLTLQAAVDAALKQYPSIRVADHQVGAAAAAINLARTAYLPRLDVLAQVNRGTRNNVFGAIFPQNTIPSISGPVIGSNNSGSVWGSATGALVSWEPFDFGRRKAHVEVAEAGRQLYEAAAVRTRFQVAVTTADAFLTLLAASQTVVAAQSGVSRANAFLGVVNAQVSAELRPGADSSRASAEVAAAQTQLAQAEQAADLGRISLEQWTGLRLQSASVEPGRLGEDPPQTSSAGPETVARNPALFEQRASVRQASEQLKALERTYFPRFTLEVATYGRGTGAGLDGSRLGGANGLAPNVGNYAIGFTITFPLMDLPAIHAREAEQSAVIQARQAEERRLTLELEAQWKGSLAALTAARKIAVNSQVQATAARDAFAQSNARYEAGLATVESVAEAQRLLTQAEIDCSLARLGVWRALLQLASAAGDIKPFLVEAAR